MNQLKPEKRAAVVRCLIEGVSVRSTVRMTGVAKNTVAKLLVDLGEACQAFHDHAVHGLKTKRVQCDEIWAFCYAKAKNVPAEKQGTFGYGDVWTWTAIDADSKLCVTWLVGDRSARCGTAFMKDTAWRIENRVQLTTDGHAAYFASVDAAFATDVDYAMLHKVYAAERAGEARYSPPICVGCETKIVSGDPDKEHISTSFVERQNLTMRMSMRRFTRLTNGFSKKVDNLAAAVALHFVWYNFGRVHQTIRKTPAMAAGIASHVWSVDELVALLDKKDSN